VRNGLEYAARYARQNRETSALVQHFADYGEDALERWATVHYAAKALTDSGRPVTVQTARDSH
jgi:hypothetical protein